VTAKEVNVSERPYDLNERTAQFGEAPIRFAKAVPLNDVSRPLISQLVRSGTSVGANYCEADGAGSRKDFLYRIMVCKREARETMHWLRMIAAAVEDRQADARILWQEAKELQLIFASIHRSGKKEK
jgi:four helix bundle protein